MTSRKKLVKKALKHPELHTEAELAFFRLWLHAKKTSKEAKKQTQKEVLV